MNGLIEPVKTMGAARLTAMGALAIGLPGIFLLIMVRLCEPTLAVLVSHLAFDNRTGVVTKLEEMGASYVLGLEDGRAAELDRNAGEPIDMCANTRLAARGEPCRLRITWRSQ